MANTDVFSESAIVADVAARGTAISLSGSLYISDSTIACRYRMSRR
jgi:hypothetical protein